MFKKMSAVILLGVCYVKLLLLKLLGRRRGLKEFLAAYKPDGIFPVTAEDDQVIRGLSRCVACRFCDAVCPRLVNEDAFPGPYALVQGWSRSLPDHRHVGNILNACADCSACELSCPTRVPLKKMIVFMRKNAAWFGGS